MAIDRTEIWMHLAKLFFSGEVVDERRLTEMAALLKTAKWSRDQTEKALLHLIAPHAKRNLGFGLPPAIGEEDFLERYNILPLMLRSEKLRGKHQWPYYFFIQDWLNKRILKKLEIERLLRLL